MKLAILSDIHGNLPALEVVADDIGRWRPDQVVVNGDIVNRGPRSDVCLDLILSQPSWRVVRGNHEDYVLTHARPGAGPNWDDPDFRINRSSYWTFQQLDGRTPSLAEMPYVLDLVAPDGSDMRMCHASMQGTRDAIWPSTPDDEVARKIAPAPTLFVNAHVHVPYVRVVNSTTLVNCGSVGSPCDGDPRASYARVEWRGGTWQAEIIRLPYDRLETAQDFEQSGFFPGCGPVGQLVFHEWRLAHSIVVPWVRDHQPMVLAGKADLGRSVDQYLASAVG